MPIETASTTTVARILECFDQPAMLVDESGRIHAANHAVLLRLASETSVVGRCCCELPSCCDRVCDGMLGGCPLRIAARDGEPARAVCGPGDRVGALSEEVLVHPVGAGEDGERLFIEVRHADAPPHGPPIDERLIGQAPAFRWMMQLVERVAPTETAVLLHGPSGTGKELVAEMLHRLSPRAAGPMVPVDCSGLQVTLFESELFGHEKGSFTGASGRKRGLVEAAQGGTLFLDEVGDIPLELQVKLLRLLESRSFRRVGGTSLLRADFRLVCATHRNLEELIAAGRFRDDLFYRISTFPIRLPPLRERREDVPRLVEEALRRLGARGGRRFRGDAMDVLLAYDFPGNVRELLNIVERACILADGDEISAEHLGRFLQSSADPLRPASREGGGAAAPSGEKPSADLVAPPVALRPRPLRLDRIVAGVEPTSGVEAGSRAGARTPHLSSSARPRASRSFR